MPNLNTEYRPVNDSGGLGRIVPLALLVVGVLLVSYLLVRLTQYKIYLDRIESDRAALNGVVRQYSFPSQYATKTAGTNVRGRILPIDLKAMSLDELYYDLPDQLRARNRDEVDTVAWLEYEPTLVGTYQTGRAYAYKCTLWLVDNSDSRITDRHEFLGTNPPEQKKWRGDAYGLKPDYMILAYLNGEDPPLRMAEFGHLSSSTIRAIVRVAFYVSWAVVTIGICLGLIQLRKRRRQRSTKLALE